jgi:hypothetical protein
MSHPQPVARRMYDLVEPLGVVRYMAEEPTEALLALGLDGYWDTYFAGRAAPLGSSVPAEVVHAVFYNFAEGEAARHIPKVWTRTTPEAVLAALERGCVAGLRTIVGDLADDPGIARTAELLWRAASSAPVGGRPLYAALRSLPAPTEPVALLWHAATLLREHRGDGHTMALVVEGIDGAEAHVIGARWMGVTDEQYGRVSHFPAAKLAAVVDGLRTRGLLDADGALTDAGRAAKERVEAMTDRLAEAPYDALSPAELDELAAGLEPVAAAIRKLLPW